MASGPGFIDTSSAAKFSALGCESKATDAEREACYASIIEEISAEQEKKKAIKAVTNGLIYICAIGAVVFLFWLFFVRLRKGRKSETPTVEAENTE